MNIRNSDKEILISIFSDAPFPIEVWAYGSRVNGEAHEGSDLDLVVLDKNQKPIPIQIYANWLDKIQESNIPILVQLLDWSRIPETFKYSILKNHEVLFEK